MKITRLIARTKFHREEGQAIVEFALVLPLLAFLIFGIFQFGVAFHNYLAITDAARVGARAAAVKRTNDPCGAASAAILATLSPRQQSDVSFPSDWCTATDKDTGDQFNITIKYPYSIGLPDFSRSGDLTASATERME
jgi:Flp pilus assembly protein TadG